MSRAHIVNVNIAVSHVHSITGSQNSNREKFLISCGALRKDILVFLSTLNYALYDMLSCLYLEYVLASGSLIFQCHHRLVFVYIMCSYTAMCVQYMESMFYINKI